jgi:pimeloyl-ACP methyl ester carboxylesterase
MDHDDSKDMTSCALCNRSASSRLEAAMFDEAVLRDHSVRVLAVDRPGHGESSPHPARNLTTFAGEHSASHSTHSPALRLHRSWTYF